MIQANELRIGNLVNILHPISKKWNFERIKAKTIANIEHNPNHDLIVNNIEPIPLTPEILEKCGFERSDNLYSMYRLQILNEWTAFYINPKHSLCELSISKHGAVVKTCKYVHQLQNLYFALTGDELEVNL